MEDYFNEFGLKIKSTYYTDFGVIYEFYTELKDYEILEIQTKYKNAKIKGKSIILE